MRYYLWTIGCQMNLADSRRAAEELERLGYRPANGPQDADLIVLNTCVVRQGAEDKVVGRLTSLRGLKRRNPGLRLALMGCFVGDVPALRRRYPWVDAFIAPSDVAAVVELAAVQAQEACTGQAQEACVEGGRKARPYGGTAGEACVEGGRALGTAGAGVTAGVPISYGCDHRCTYCIVRLRRGPEVSRPMEEIVAEVRRLAGRGVREVTLLGQNVDSYGRDLAAASLAPRAPAAVGAGASPAPTGAAPTGAAPPDLAGLLEVVHEVEGLVRIRFLTSHPADMSRRLVETAARLPKVCEQIELPVQSGDDEVLRRMGRGYSADQYRELAAQIRAAMTVDVGLATDVIVGFPGESEAQFEATYRLLEELRFDMVHVAAYSPRPGTPAERLANDVPPAEKERRRRAVDLLQERVVGEINAGLLDRTVEILVEGRHKGKWMGRTRSNKLVFFDVDLVDDRVHERDWSGELVRVRVTRTGPWSMQARLEGV